MIEPERMTRAESKLEHHSERINRLDAAINQAIDAQALLHRNIIQLSEQTKTMSSMQALLAKIEERQEKTSEHIYGRLREVEIATALNGSKKLQGDGIFADWFGKILIPVVSALIASAGVIIAMIKLSAG